MKKTLAILLSLMLVVIAMSVPAVALADNGAAPVMDWRVVLIDNALEIVTAFVVTLIGVFGVWLTSVIGKHEKFKTVNAAQKELIRMAQITVGELKQTLADGLKAAAQNGKLTKADIARLNTKLLEKTKDKMSAAALDVLAAAAVDVNKLIIGAGEDWIGQISATVATTYNITNQQTQN